MDSIPSSTDRLQQEGDRLIMVGKPMEAVASYQKTLQLDAGRMDVWEKLVSALQQLNFVEEAASSLVQMGNIYRSNDIIAEAAACYFRATKLQPNDVQNYSDCASMLIMLFEFNRALNALNKAAQLEPSNAKILLQRSAVHAHLGGLHAAITDVENALSLQSDLPMANVHLASLQLEAGDYNQAEERCRQSLQQNPNDAEAEYTLAKIFVVKHHFDEAEKHYRASIVHQQNFALANFGLARLLLGHDSCKEGWEKFQWRHQTFTQENSLGHTGPGYEALTNPETLRSNDYHTSGKWLVVEDAGLGDQLMFLRFTKRLVEQGMDLSYLASPKLIPILKRHDLCFEILDSACSDHEHCIKVGDLPLLCANQSVPPSLKLRALKTRKQALLTRLSKLGPPPYIALTWKGGVARFGSLQKEIDVAQFGEVFKNIKGTLISVQRNPLPEETELLSTSAGCPVHDFSDTNTDLEDALAIMDIVDNYIGVSNTNMHLRAALGKTASVLVCNPQEWRWGNSGSESAWFTGFSLYRETSNGWRDALEQLKVDQTR